ncbi:protein downstream neighbor of son homolog, partial [Diaphorina citri]|uniref:Protein downstream neighbor of son homolog n=1 Tax=Diaphorina citri TaxID=121845 RepID=A0A1S4EL37_DIACI
MCSDKTPGTPTGWKTPGDVMKLHRLKIKQKALNARLTGNSTSQSSSKLPSRNVTDKTINPFRKCSSTVNLGTAQSSNKRSRADLEEEEVSNDDGGTLFRLLGGKSRSDNIENISSFENILSKISNPAQTVKKQDLAQGFDQVPLDWTLRSKMRFMSRKPFPWNQKLKTCEEASGITGFVRCVDTDPSVSTGASCSNLDTSPNAQFLTTCMFWQHPHLPWLQLFPRSRLKGPTAVYLPEPAVSGTPCIFHGRKYTDNIDTRYAQQQQHTRYAQHMLDIDVKINTALERHINQHIDRTGNSIVMLMFREEKSPEDEIKAWQFWHSRQHSVKQRILDA